MSKITVGNMTDAQRDALEDDHERAIEAAFEAMPLTTTEGDTMQATEDKTYNGWTNYATWGVALVLDNDQGTYNEVRGRIDSIKEEAAISPNVTKEIWTADEAARFGAADFLKDYTEQMCDEGCQDSTNAALMARQMVQAGLSNVDWDEIANHVLSE